MHIHTFATVRNYLMIVSTALQCFRKKGLRHIFGTEAQAEPENFEKNYGFCMCRMTGLWVFCAKT